jgi:hypothetical protein
MISIYDAKSEGGRIEAMKIQKGTKMAATKERDSERAMRLSQPAEPLNITFDQWFSVLEKFVKAGNCLIDDIYGVHKITRICLADNSKGKATGLIFKSDR